MKRMRKNPGIGKIEQMLKRAVRNGGMDADFSESDIEFLLSRSTQVRPSKDLTDELEVILLRALEESRSEVLVKEKKHPYHSAAITVGEALGEVFHVNGWRNDDVGNRLGVSPVIVEQLLEEVMPLTAATVRAIVDSLGGKHRLPNTARGLLAQWLLNGLHFIQLRPGKGQGGSMRSAARKNRKRGKRK